MRPDLQHLRTTLGSGLIVLLPFLMVVFALGLVFRLMRDLTDWLYVAVLEGPLGEKTLTALGLPHGPIEELPTLMQWALSGVSVLSTLALVYVLGLASRYVAGRRAVKVAEDLVDRIPMAGPIYGASKQVLDAFSGDRGRAFQEVVLAPYPSATLRSVAFVTNSGILDADGAELLTLFIATTPNPTTGFVFLARRQDCIALPWSLDLALRAVMSAGVLMPPQVPWSRASDAAVASGAPPDSSPP